MMVIPCMPNCVVNELHVPVVFKRCEKKYTRYNGVVYNVLSAGLLLWEGCYGK